MSKKQKTLSRKDFMKNVKHSEDLKSALNTVVPLRSSFWVKQALLYSEQPEKVVVLLRRVLDSGELRGKVVAVVVAVELTDLAEKNEAAIDEMLGKAFEATATLLRDPKKVQNAS